MPECLLKRKDLAVARNAHHFPHDFVGSYGWVEAGYGVTARNQVIAGQLLDSMRGQLPVSPVQCYMSWLKFR